jgi:epoxyqueuosine reductase QueG
MSIDQRIKALLISGGACDVGFCRVPDGPEGLPYALSMVLPLSDAVIDEIKDAPTYSYFHHYRTANAYIDRLLFKAGLLLESEGWRYMPVAASQSIPDGGERTHRGRYSHKKAAVLAGLGCVGKSALFLHRERGARVRLGTLFTDCPLPASAVPSAFSCEGCDLCVKACPAGAIKGVTWREGIDRDEMFDAEACNDYMRGHFMKIGRGSVCGICVSVCPFNGRGK